MKTKFFQFFLLLFLASAVSFNLNAQGQVFDKGDKDLNVGIGFGSSRVTSGYNGIVPPISASFDYGLRDDWGPGVFGIGAYVGTSLYRSRYYNAFNNKYGYNYTNIILASRATYHYTFVDKLDTYAGFIAGIGINANSKYGDWPDYADHSPDNSVYPALAAFAGAKYYFTDSFAAYSELGIGIVYFTVGVAFKF